MTDFPSRNPSACLPVTRLGTYAALLIAGLVFAVTVRSNLFVAGGSDSSGYLSASELWRTGFLYRPEPLVFWATWPSMPDVAFPLGYRSGPIRGTEVSFYPPGFPILLAAATEIGGPMAGHLVSPLMAGVLVFAAFAVGRAASGTIAGLIAAALTASSAELLLHSVHAMGDVPAAAFWILAWWCALRGTVSGAAAAGSLAAFALLIRPNLAPLAGVIGLAILVGDSTAPDGRREWRWLASALFAGFVALGVAVLMWTQDALYGSPLAPSYPGWSTLFSAKYILPNCRMYLRLFAEAHTLWPTLGVAVAAAALWRASRLNSEIDRRVALSGGGIMAVNLLLYLPYMPFDHWPFLRFLLPGTTALFVLFAALVAVAVRAAWRRLKYLAILLPLLLAPIALHGRPLGAYALNDWRAQSNVRLMGHYLREALPQNAIVLAFAHSGAVAYYTGREIVRLDLIEPSALDAIIDDLARHGYRPVFLLDQLLEEKPFKQRFVTSRYGKLDWPMRARFASVTPIWYFDPADKAAYDRGVRWPIDTVR